MVEMNSLPASVDSAAVGKSAWRRSEVSTLPSGERQSAFSWLLSSRQLTYLGFAALLIAWIWRLWVNWACWGSLTVDCGRELYVAAMLARGKMLYRDVWYLYHPAAPYFNSLLFRIFGVRVEVFYIAGSLAALGSACFLYLTGIRLSARLAGWTAACALILEAFARQLFSFPLPYSFAAVYGCLVACLFLWLLVSACQSPNSAWILGLGCASAAAMLLKMEYGFACYSALALLLFVRAVSQKSWVRLGKDVAAVFPGVAVCGAVAAWMISIGGLNFLLQENLASWPTSYFMRHYGKLWLINTGFDFTWDSLSDAAMQTLVLGCWLIALYAIFFWKKRGGRPLTCGIVLLLTVVFLFARMDDLDSYDIIRILLFPPVLVFYVAIAAVVAGFLFLRDPLSTRKLALALLFSFSVLLAFRIILRTLPVDYSIYYSGPALFSLLLLLSLGVRRFAATSLGRRGAEIGISAACLFAVGFCVFPIGLPKESREALVTPYGMVRAGPETVHNYAAAIAFMRDKNSRGQVVLSLPEDTSLYFFSGIEAPLRFYAFTPGMLAPGPMSDKIIRSLEEHSPQYLLWSNRVFPEYQAMIFGRDFDRPIGDYLRVHYHRLGLLPPHEGNAANWQVAVWERNTDDPKP